MIERIKHNKGQGKKKGGGRRRGKNGKWKDENIAL